MILYMSSILYYIYFIISRAGYYSGQWREGQRQGYGIRGWAPIDELKDGAVSVKRLFASAQITPREKRPATICGADQLYGPDGGASLMENSGRQQQSGVNGTAERPVWKTTSNPSTLNRQFTLDSVTLEEPANVEVVSKKSSK